MGLPCPDAFAAPQLSACLARAPKCGVTAVHLAQAAAVSGEIRDARRRATDEMQAELMKALGVAAIPDKLAFIRQLVLQAPPA